MRKETVELSTMDDPRCMNSMRTTTIATHTQASSTHKPVREACKRLGLTELIAINSIANARLRESAVRPTETYAVPLTRLKTGNRFSTVGMGTPTENGGKSP